MSRNIANRFYFSQYNTRFLVAVFVVIALLAADMSISNVSDMIGEQLASPAGMAFFVVTAVAYAAGQYAILEMVKRRNREIITSKSPSSLRFSRVNMGVTAAQYALTAIVAFVVIQTLFTSRYSTAALVADTALSYSLATIITGLLSVWLFSWYRSSKSFVTLLYGLSTAMVTASTALMLAFYNILLLDKPAEIGAQSPVTFQFFDPGSLLGMLQYSFTTLNVVNFLLLWASTALLLRHYSRKIGKIKFWTILGIPLASFLSIFFVVTPLVASSTPQDANMVYVIIFGYTLPGIAGGVLFGVPFWIIARNISHAGLRSHMIITACGFVLSFVAGTATVAHAPYPPFGLASVSFTGLASYLILSGLYSSVISISEDARLRQAIRKSAIEESKLLGSMGLAQMKEEVLRRVMRIARDNSDAMTSKTGVNPSFTEDDMMEYLNVVLEEIKGKKAASKVKGARDAAAG